MDVRVDDHAAPLGELRRLQQVFAEELLPQVMRLPTRTNLTGDLSKDTHDGLA